MTKQDHAGNAAYAAKFEYFTAWRISAVAFFGLFLCSGAVNVWQSSKPPIVMVTRVDDAGRAQAITFRSNDYTPREAEVVSGLNAWAVDRFRLVKAVVDTNFRANYYFLDSRLARQLSIGDADVVASILAGKIPEQDVQVNSIRFRSFETKKELDGTVGNGECVIDLYKTYNVTGQAREHWLLTVKYRVNPTAAAERSRRDPAFQLVNPLGLTITWFHEDRELS